MADVFSLALGPVQDFLSAARRTPDLWFGSWLLSELARAAGKNLRENGECLIFPDAGRLNDAGATFSNKILAIVEHPPVDLAALLRAAIDRRLVELRDEAFTKEYRILFGAVEDAGHVTFHDALWIPFKDDGEKLPSVPLLADVMTVHHRDYYGGDRRSEAVAPPADWDDPNPVSFVSAHGTYLVALTGPAEWLDVAFTILAGALEHDGVGAKTAAGYARMTLIRQQS